MPSQQPAGGLLSRIRGAIQRDRQGNGANRRAAPGLGEIIDGIIEPFSPEWVLRRRMARNAMSAATEHKGADRGRLRADWIVGPGSPTPVSSERALLINRSRDLVRNDAIASGITGTMGANIVGSGLRFQSRIRAEALGVGEKEAEKLRRQAEDVMAAWGKKADAGNILTWSEIQFLALTQIIEQGETIAVPTWASEPWRKFGRCIEMVESERLCHPGGLGVTGSMSSGYYLASGIDTGDRGQPVAYWVKKASATGLGVSDFQKIEPFDAAGRPKILHVFHTKRAGQMRGIPVMAPVITMFKDLAGYLEAEVVAARISACMALIFTKKGGNPMAAALAAATGTSTAQTSKPTSARLQEFFPGMVHYADSDEEVTQIDPKRPGDTFEPFVLNCIRLIGASLGIPYELVMKDFSKTNYSSARAALLEARRMFTHWRTWFAAKFCQPIFELVIEEAFLRGMFEAPDFYARREEYCRAAWIGGGWGWVDPVKEIEASRLACDYGLSTLAEENAGQGRDYDETLDQRGREIPRERSLGISNAAKSASTVETKALPAPSSDADGDDDCISEQEGGAQE